MIRLTSLIQQNTAESQEKTLIKRFTQYCEQQGLSEGEINHHIKWILQFTQFHNHQHPSDLNESDIHAYLYSLAVDHLFDTSIQEKALGSLRFLYQDFLKRPLQSISYVKSDKRRSIADRFSRQDCRSTINNMTGTSQLMAKLAFEGHLKLKQVVNLRLSDVNIKSNRIFIRDPQQQVQFAIKIPLNLILDLRIQLMRVRQLEQGRRNQSTLKSLTHNPGIFSKNKECIHQDFLFPAANSENSTQSSQAKQLALLKNDIRIAIKQFLRFSSIDSNDLSSTRLNNIATNRRSKITSIKKQPQRSFDFADLLVDQTGQRAHALKRGAA